MPEKVTALKDKCFYRCGKLEKADLSYGLESIGEECFSNTGLKGIVIPDSVKQIGAKAFFGCHSRETAVLPAGLEEIPQSLFYGCKKLSETTIPDTVTKIGASAFYSCESLPGIAIPDSVTSIGASAFYNWLKLTNLKIGSGVKEIGDKAFGQAAALKTLTLPDGLETIGYDAFWACKSLTAVTLGSSVRSIGDGAFSKCDSLTDVYYAGTEAQWNAIRIGRDNDPLLNAKIHFESAPGDVNADDDLTAPDAHMVLYRLITAGELLDVNGDGRADAYDAAFVLKYIVGLL